MSIIKTIQQWFKPIEIPLVWFKVTLKEEFEIIEGHFEGIGVSGDLNPKIIQAVEMLPEDLPVNLTKSMSNTMFSNRTKKTDLYQSSETVVYVLAKDLKEAILLVTAKHIPDEN